MTEIEYFDKIENKRRSIGRQIKIVGWLIVVLLIIAFTLLIKIALAS